MTDTPDPDTGPIDGEAARLHHRREAARLLTLAGDALDDARPGQDIEYTDDEYRAVAWAAAAARAARAHAELASGTWDDAVQLIEPVELETTGPALDLPDDRPPAPIAVTLDGRIEHAADLDHDTVAAAITAAYRRVPARHAEADLALRRQAETVITSQARLSALRAGLARVFAERTGPSFRHASPQGMADAVAGPVVDILDALDRGDPVDLAVERVEDPATLAEMTTAIEAAGGLRGLLDELIRLRHVADDVQARKFARRAATEARKMADNVQAVDAVQAVGRKDPGRQRLIDAVAEALIGQGRAPNTTGPGTFVDGLARIIVDATVDEARHYIEQVGEEERGATPEDYGARPLPNRRVWPVELRALARYLRDGDPERDLRKDAAFLDGIAYAVEYDTRKADEHPDRPLVVRGTAEAMDAVAQFPAFRATVNTDALGYPTAEPEADGLPHPDLWHVRYWNVVDGGILGAVAVCPSCEGRPGPAGCETCSKTGSLHVPYRTPAGGMLDVHRHPDALAVFDQPPPAPGYPGNCPHCGALGCDHEIGGPPPTDEATGPPKVGACRHCGRPIEQADKGWLDDRRTYMCPGSVAGHEPVGSEAEQLPAHIAELIADQADAPRLPRPDPRWVDASHIPVDEPEPAAAPDDEAAATEEPIEGPPPWPAAPPPTGAPWPPPDGPPL